MHAILCMSFPMHTTERWGLWRQERKARKRAQQKEMAQQMSQYDKGGFLLQVIASKAKTSAVRLRSALNGLTSQDVQGPDLLKPAVTHQSLGCQVDE